jgi:tetratricopeptide (TPR) repeat protein
MKLMTLIRWMSLTWILTFFIAISPGFATQSSVEDAILKGNWEVVYNSFDKDTAKANDPIARFLMGHVCLATNRNNESMLHFLSVKAEKDLQSWSGWTDSLLHKYPDNPVVIYLSADAKARAGKFEEALEGFTQALQRKEDFALAMNARGVVRALTNDWDNAQVDFYMATKLDPSFADAYANLGMLGIFRETSLDLDTGTLNVFNQALKINPEFALAYNGRGCIYFGSGRFEESAKDFEMASQLCPVLVMAEINNGFASAYASKLVTLASMERKPGTTYENLNQRYPNVLEEQQQPLLNMLPSQKDQAFWKKMDALPWILQSDEKTQALVDEYGLQKVQMGAFIKMQEYKSQIAEANQKVQSLHSRISSYDQKIGNLQTAELVTSLGFSAWGTSRDLQKGWEYAQLKTDMRMNKTALSSLTPNQTLKTVIDAIPTSLSPPGLAASTASSGFKIGRSVLEDKRDAAWVEFDNLASQVPVWSTQLRYIEMNLPKLGGTPLPELPSKSPAQVPGYYTYSGRPIIELSALASMVDKGIKPVGDLPRSALIVSQDPFRTNLLQSELSKHGFQTKVISPSADPQIIAKQWGADVILGIGANPEMQMPELKSVSGSINTPQMILPPIKQNLDWGMPYIPNYPKGGPGGISTEELARSFVDKGNWPILTCFGLFYETGPSMIGVTQEGGK